MSIRVLIVDDQILTRLGVRTALATAPDVQVVGETSTGEGAVIRAQQLKPDVILVDLDGGPGNDTVEVIRRIRRCCPRSGVILLGSHVAEGLVRLARDAGASGCLSKDISPAGLTHAVRAAHAGAPLMAPRGAQPPPTNDPGPAPGLRAGRRRRGELTSREWEVLLEAARGLSDREIAGKLYLSLSTVKSHLRSIYRQLGLHNRAQAVAFVMERSPMGGRAPSSPGSSNGRLGP